MLRISRLTRIYQFDELKRSKKRETADSDYSLMENTVQFAFEWWTNVHTCCRERVNGPPVRIRAIKIPLKRYTSRVSPLLLPLQTEEMNFEMEERESYIVSNYKSSNSQFVGKTRGVFFEIAPPIFQSEKNVSDNAESMISFIFPLSEFLLG